MLQATPKKPFENTLKKYLVSIVKLEDLKKGYADAVVRLDRLRDSLGDRVMASSLNPLSTAFNSMENFEKDVNAKEREHSDLKDATVRLLGIVGKREVIVEFSQEEAFLEGVHRRYYLSLDEHGQTVVRTDAVTA
ncbi:MAG: hypothetical protein EOP48_25075 [Sphingobacteriales bacterium]|nr:MAG: hypothetical protein EOP48_25075 [Sphingobacteriales bacterium]